MPQKIFLCKKCTHYLEEERPFPFHGRWRLALALESGRRVRGATEEKLVHHFHVGNIIRIIELPMIGAVSVGAKNLRQLSSQVSCGL